MKPHVLVKRQSIYESCPTESADKVLYVVLLHGQGVLIEEILGCWRHTVL